MHRRQQRNNTCIERIFGEKLSMPVSIVNVTVFVFILLHPVNSLGVPEITFRNNVIGFVEMEPEEVFSNSSDAQSVSEGAFEPEISWYGDIVEEGFSTGDLQLVYSTLSFSRWTNATGSNRPWLWRYRQQKNEHPSQPSFSVSYSIEDEYGNNGKLTHTADSESWIEVTVVDEKIIDNSKKKRWIFKGSAKLEFNISNARRSGVYRGSILTTLTYL